MSYFFFDLETTGADPTSAHIVQIAYLLCDDSLEPISKGCHLVNPGALIEPGASRVHGITNEAVKNEPYFKQYAQTFHHLMSNTVWVGYNNLRFDNIIIRNEFDVCGLQKPPCAGTIDCFKIFTYYEGKSKKRGTRTLSAAHKFYCTYDYDNAHDALADVIATWNVYRHQLDYYHITLKEALKICRKNDYAIDQRGFFRFDNTTKKPIVAMGKYSGTPLNKVPANYLRWITSSNFDADTKKVAEDALAGFYPIY